MLNKRRIKLAAVYCILACLALVAAACGGSGIAVPADAQYDAQQLAGTLPPLSEVADLARSASADTELVKLGVESQSQSGGALPDGDSLVLATSETHHLEWAMYLYQLNDKVPRRFITDLTINNGEYWLAVANFELGQWELVGPLDEGAYEFNTIPFASYKSAGNIAVIAVLAGRMDGVDSDIAVNSMTLVAGSGTSPEL